MRMPRHWNYGSLRWVRKDWKIRWQPAAWVVPSRGESPSPRHVMVDAGRGHFWVAEDEWEDYQKAVRFRWRWLSDWFASHYAKRQDKADSRGEWRIG